MLVPSREELAWAAGFFDGEGTTHVAWRGPDHEFPQLHVSVPQSGDEECLLRFMRAVGGIGRLYALSLTKNARLPRYRWQVSRFSDAQAAIAMLWPFLSSPKRQQAAGCLRQMRQYHAEKAARAATRAALRNQMEVQ